MEMKALLAAAGVSAKAGCTIDRVGLQRILAALDREHDVGFGGDDRFVVDDLVAVIAVDRVDAAGQRDDLVRGGLLARRPSPGRSAATSRTSRAPALSPWRAARAVASRSSVTAVVRHSARASAPMAWPTSLILSSRPCFGKGFRHQHQRHLGRFEHVHGFLRAGSLHREHQRRVEPEHAFGRKLAHVADIGLVAQRCGRIEAGGVDAGEPVLEAERVENFGDGAADRNDPRWIVADRDVAVARVVHRDARGECGAAGARERRRRRPGCACDKMSSQRSLGQDQLVLRRQPQAISVLAMRDDDLALARKQLAAVDPVAVHDNGSCCVQKEISAFAFRCRRAVCRKMPSFWFVALRKISYRSMLV